MTKQELIPAVLHEVEGIRKHATEEEKGRLDFGKLNPNNVGFCIYGQMCGNCFSSRATELITKIKPAFSLSSMTAERAEKSSTKNLRKRNPSWHFYDAGPFTPMEYFIVQYRSHNRDIIAYIKGERETLKLNH